MEMDGLHTVAGMMDNRWIVFTVEQLPLVEKEWDENQKWDGVMTLENMLCCYSQKWQKINHKRKEWQQDTWMLSY